MGRSRAPSGGRKGRRAHRPHGPPLPWRGSRSRGSRLRCPPASGTRSLGRARSQSPPPTSSSTSSSAAAATAHLLPPPPPQPQPPFPPLSSSVLAFCRLSGKRRSSEIQSPSAAMRHPPAAPRPRDRFRALGISQAQRRGPLCALGAGEMGRNACKRCMHAGECMYLRVLGSAPSAPRKWGGGELCPQGGARMTVT